MTRGRLIDGAAAPAAPVVACIGVGSNVGDRAGHVAHACSALDRVPKTRVLRTSSVRETAPVGPPGQGPYLNAVVVVETGLAAEALLLAMLAIERERGRDRSLEERFGPRTLDLDLLTWGTAAPGADRIDRPGLTVPHPRMHEREFVLEPLAEVAPGFAAAARSTCID